MFKSSRLSSAKQNNNNGKQEGEKQKQKKRLSFKDPPEVEKPRTSANLLIQTPELSREQLESGSTLCRRISSLEDLRLEDQALQIARNVGFAFVKPDSQSTKVQNSERTPSSSKTIEVSSRETTQKEFPLDGYRSKSKTDQDTKRDQEKKHQEYLEALSPPTPKPTAMRCPITEFPSETSPKNAGLMSEQQGLPTIAHHQIQLLNYQLEQQRQQTQTAMYQIQLLKDQLEAESAARFKAQVHNHQLMMQNKELLDHIQRLFQQVQELEKKIEDHENKATQEPKQDAIGLHGQNSSSYRRNSASAQSIWSSTSSLNPGYNPARRVSATSLILQQPEPKPVEGGRRSSIKDDSSSRFSSPFDTDWRYRRRGSSSAFSSATNLTMPKNSELNIGGEPDKPSTEPPRSPSMSFSIPELKLTTLDAGRSSKSGSISNIRGATRKAATADEPLTIRDSSKDVATSKSGANQLTVGGFKPIQSERPTSPSYFTKSSHLTDRESDAKGRQKKLMKSLDTLKLFNS